MGAQDFTIETKLKISGVEATGTLDAGTLKFKVDTSALKKLVSDAGKAADKVRDRFNNIKLNKIKIELNQASLRQMEAQIRNSIKNAVGNAKIVIDTSLGKGLQGDPFKAQRAAAQKSADSLRVMHDLTKDVNNGLRSLITTLSKLDIRAMNPAGGPAMNISGLPLPATARTINTTDLSKEIAQIKQVGMVDDKVTQDRLKNAEKMATEFAKVEKARLARITQLKEELDALFKKEQKLTMQLSGAGTGAGLPPGGFGGGGGGGGFGATPPGGNFDKSRSSAGDLAKAISQVGVATRTTRRDMDDLNQLAFEVGRKAAAFRGVAIAINTVVNSAQAAAKFIIDYNDSLLELNKILQADKPLLQLVGDSLFDLAKSTGVGVKETVDIATEFARAGLEGRGYGTIVDLTAQALTGLQGTSLDANQATDLLIQTIQQLEGGARGLGKELLENSRLFDILGRAEDIKASKASDIQDAFKRSLASLAATGASMEQLTAIVSVLQERTQRGGDVIGTALKTLASRVSDSSSDASQALKSIGVATVDAEGKLRNIFDILRDTSAAFQNLSEAEQSNIAVKAAGVRQVEIFRAALQNFTRLQAVETDLENSSGDAARKQAREQEKLGTTIKKIQIALQQLIKTGSEGILGEGFVLATKGVEKLLSSLAALDQAFGGTISTFGGIIALKAAFSAIIPLIRGITKAFSMFVHSQDAAGSRMKMINDSGTRFSNTVQNGINPALARTAQTMHDLNEQMQMFEKASELSAVQAERLAKAREIAVREFGASGKKPTANQVNSRVSDLMNAPTERQTTLRGQSLTSLIGQGRSKDIIEAARQAPSQFTTKELERIARLEEDVAKEGGKFNSALGGLQAGFTKAIKSTLLQGLALNVIAGALDNVGDSAKNSESGLTRFGAGMAKVLGNAAQFASFGLLFGPLGAGIGAVLGSLTGFIEILSKSADTVDDLAQHYAKLGLIQTENGKLSVSTGEKIEKAFKNIQEAKAFNLTQAKTGEIAAGTPEGAKRQKQLDDSSKNLMASYDRSATVEEKRNQILEAANTALKANTGSKFDLADQTLKAGSEALKEITQQQFDAIVEALSDIAPPDAKTEIRDKAQELFKTVGDSLNIDDMKSQAAAIRKRQSEFAQRVEEMLPKDVVGQNKPFAKALESLSKGIDSEEVQKTISGALEKAAKGAGPSGAGGVNLTLRQVENVVADARKLGEITRQSRTNVTRGGAALPQILSDLPKLIGESIIKSQDEAAKAQRDLTIQTTRDAFNSLTMEFVSSGNDVAKLITSPVNKLQVELRDFIASFSEDVVRLQEATINATTPQKELAAELAKFAALRVDELKASRGVQQADAIQEFRKSIQELTGGERKIGRDVNTGAVLKGFTPENADRTVGQVRQELISDLLGALEEIRTKKITSPIEQRRTLENRASKTNVGAILSEEELKTIIEGAQKLGKAFLSIDLSVTEEESKLNKARVDELKAVLSEQAKDIALNQQRREVLSLNNQAAIEELTSVRQLAAARLAESSVASDSIKETAERLQFLNKRLGLEKELLNSEKATAAEKAGAKDRIETLQDEANKEAISLEEQLAKERIAAIKNVLQVAQESINVGQKEAEFQKSQIASRGEIIDLLSAGEKQVDKFNRKLAQNADSFKQTQAELAAEFRIINATITDGAEKEARLSDVRKKAASAALEAAKAEAEIVAERRQAVQQLVQEALSNQQEQVNAQKAIIDATKALSDAYKNYREAIQGSILATAQYTIGVKLAQVETIKLTGGFAGIKEQIVAVSKIYKDATKVAMDVGASEKTLLELRRQSITQQLQLFTQLLNEQSSLARNFFQSSAEDQAALFQGIQQAKGVANILGGSFANFKKMGQDSINALGKQLLALPQETRQQIVKSLETLGQLGGAQIGGFTSDQLLTAIETASLGVDQKPGGRVNVDPLFEVQKHIADLTQEQAKIATDQLMATQQAVDQAKQQLDEAKANKALAEIQLERLKETGAEIQGKIAELNQDLKTVLLQQDANQKNGFSMVTGIIGRTNDIITNTLPDALSVKIAQAFRDALSQGGVSVPGLTPPPDNGMFDTAQSRGSEMAQNFRREGVNTALQSQIANSAGLAPAIVSSAFGGVQQQPSNLPAQQSAQDTNQKLADILSELKNVSTATTDGTQVLTDIRDGTNSVTGGTAAASLGATPTSPQVNINIQGQQTITVTGFEAGVARIAQGLAETLGGFATDQEARDIANQVVESIRLELERLGILNRNQL
jgi:TP901 family phage tail tape measure protein